MNSTNDPALEWRQFFENTQSQNTAHLGGNSYRSGVNQNSHFRNRFSETNRNTLNQPSQNYYVNNDEIYIQMQNQQLTSINNLIYDYNRNMRDYQRNMGDCIRILRNIRMNFLNQQTFGEARPPPTNSFFNRPSQTDSTQLLFSYTLYPVNETSNSQLTTYDISQNTRTFQYTEEMAVVSSDGSNNVCPISLDTFSVGDVLCQIVECGHIFKKPALLQWFRNHSSCPVCRYNLLRPPALDASNNTIQNAAEMDSNQISDIVRRFTELIIDSQNETDVRTSR
jgi:Ring finger domain